MEDEKKLLEAIETSVKTVVDEAIEKNLEKAIGKSVTEKVTSIVEKMRLQNALTGSDMSGLSMEKKAEFAKAVKSQVFGLRTKANEALIEDVDNRGGLLVGTEIADAILRIAASVGVVLSQAQNWSMGTDELDIPAYRGSFLEGEFLGVDAAGTPTALTFASARLLKRRWQLAFVVGNDLLADASANLGEWLLALGGEALANMVDKQAFNNAGVGPFVSLLSDSNVNVWNLGGSTTSGQTTFSSFTLDDASDMIAQVEESTLDGAAFYFNRTVWAKIRMKKDTNGDYVVSQARGDELVAIMAKNGGIRPAGMLLGYPVYTVRHLPANSATAVSTKFCVFGNLKAFAFGGDKNIRVAEHASGSFGGKEIGLADQRALVYKARVALVNALPASFVVGKTAAS